MHFLIRPRKASEAIHKRPDLKGAFAELLNIFFKGTQSIDSTTKDLLNLRL